MKPTDADVRDLWNSIFQPSRLEEFSAVGADVKMSSKRSIARPS